MALIEHLEKLRHFIQLAKFTSIKSAAFSTGISQAGLSKSISNLESVLGAALFYRSPEGLTLTKEGAILLRAAKEITDEANRVENEIHSLSKERGPSKLRIGMYDSIAIYMYLDLEKYLQSMYQGIEIELCVVSSPQLLRLTLADQLDLSIGVNLNRSLSHGFEFFPFFEDYFSIYSKTESSKQRNQPVLYHPEATDSEEVSLEDHLRKKRRAIPTYRVYHMETIKLLVVQGLGMGLLPTNVARPYLLNGLISQISIDGLPKQFGRHTIGLLATPRLLEKNKSFALDLVRLAKAWSLK